MFNDTFLIVSGEFCPKMHCNMDNIMCFKTFFQMSVNKPADYEVKYCKLTVSQLGFG